MQIALGICREKRVAHDNRRSQAPILECILTPNAGTVTRIKGVYMIFIGNCVDITETTRQTTVGRKILTPYNLTITGVQRHQTSLVAAHVDQTVVDQRLAIDVDNTLQLGTPLGQSNALLPHRSTRLVFDRNQLAISKAGKRQICRNDRSTGTTQAQSGNLAVITPAPF